ncbi:HAD-IA family hydrolase [Flaviflexus massiliensis]|uniref:HAD-IA family hydrolase n=1 Tax=Flaviflexus massiliensis TaxID=1522309 RepID=UPI0006D57F65|nr:HAD-IA family hydrolase [Flaviflexus massiliensis]
MKLGAILFDLDGTIIDSAPIITSLLAKTAETITGKPVESADMIKYVGPPLKWSMGDMGAAEDDIPEYIAYYRSHYDEVMTLSPVFSGMAELLQDLSAVLPIGLATSKKLSGAKLTLEAKGLDHLFTVIRGGSEDGLSARKADIISSALEGIGPVEGEVLMVGDRIYDIEGADANNLKTIIVSWGAGGQEERDRAWKTVDTTDQLRELLFSIIPAP